MVASAEYHFDQAAADYAVEFYPLFLTHLKGAKAGKPFHLLEWQADIVRQLFGWKRPDGSRRYRTCYVEVPRKNGKSLWAAGLALYMLLCDGEESPEVFSCASTRDQASLVFNMAADMARKTPKMLEHLKIRDSRKTMYNQSAGGFYRALSSDAGGQHGHNASAIIFDELHTQPTRELWDVMTTSVGARSQPLTIAITTAGHDRTSICWELHQKALAVRDGVDTDDTFLGVVFGAETEDDWTSVETWHKANPSLGEAVTVEYLDERCKQAQANPAVENTFRQLHLNQWTEQALRIIPMRDWDECPEDMPDELLTRPCFAGLDLASTRDVTAFTLVWPLPDGEFAMQTKCWIPEDAISSRAANDRTQVVNLAQRGLVQTTPGNVMDVYYIADEINTFLQTYNLCGIAYDPHLSREMLQVLDREHGVSPDVFFKVPQTFGNMSEPFSKFLELVKSHKLHHGKCPVLRWMATNTAHRVDPSGRIRPDKEKSGDKIDAVVAGVMGLALAITGQGLTRNYEGSGTL